MTSQPFPQEILDRIGVYLELELACVISDYAAHKCINYGSLSWENAVEGGDINTIRWLNENNITGFSDRIANIVISWGRLDVAEYLHFNLGNCFGNDDVDTAAMEGHLDILEFLLNVCKLDCTFNAIDLASRGGYLEIVKLLTLLQKPCTTNALDWAIEFGFYDVVEYLVENRKEGCTKRALDLGRQHGNRKLADYISQNQHRIKVT